MLTLAPLPRKSSRERIKGWTLATTKGSVLCTVWTRQDKRKVERAMDWLDFRMSWSLPRLRREVCAQLFEAGVPISRWSL